MTNRSSNSEYLTKKFRESLIIDRFDPLIELRTKKFNQNQHDIHEDSIVWNIFRTLNQMERSIWVPLLFEKSFSKGYYYHIEQIEIKFWQKFWPNRSRKPVEGSIEVDIIIESEEFVWFIESKYGSDISMEINNNPKRDEVIRQIDLGTGYAKKKDFYYTLLILDRFHSPNGFRITTNYKNNVSSAIEKFSHHYEENLKGISIMTWKELQETLKIIYLYARGKYEKFIVNQAATYLLEKIREDEI